MFQRKGASVEVCLSWQRKSICYAAWTIDPSYSCINVARVKYYAFKHAMSSLLLFINNKWRCWNVIQTVYCILWLEWLNITYSLIYLSTIENVLGCTTKVYNGQKLVFLSTLNFIFGYPVYVLRCNFMTYLLLDTSQNMHISFMEEHHVPLLGGIILMVGYSKE